MDNFIVVISIMAIFIALAAFSKRLKLPLPVLLVLAGLIIGFIPNLQHLALDPEVIFIIMLPPILYDAASKTSWLEFKTSIRPISALAITLVFFTTIAVAITAHYMIPGFTWPLAFVLGAVVSPPDAVAATGIIKGLGLNRKVITILEGESLVNDASALIAYRYAVLAVTTGSFVWWQAGLQFLLVAALGIAIGIITGLICVWAHKRILDNPVVETSITLIAPFISYVTAEHFELSGVLAVVTTGLLVARKAPEVFSFQARMRSRVLWDTIIFLLQGFIFIMIGLQLPSIIEDMGNYPMDTIIGYGLVISLVTIIVRIIWVFTGANWQRFSSRKKKVESDDTWKSVLVVAWTGTRGVISLAAALALPFVLQDGDPFPKRSSIIFLAFVVIFMTLVVQGLSLPLLIKLLKIKPATKEQDEVKELQLFMANNTLEFIEKELPQQDDSRMYEQLKISYEQEIRILSHELRIQHNAKTKAVNGMPAEAVNKLSAQLNIINFQRTLLIKLHKDGHFNNDALRHFERELDIEELKINERLPTSKNELDVSDGDK